MAYSIGNQIVIPAGTLIIAICYIAYWFYLKRQNVSVVCSSKLRFVFAFYAMIIALFTLFPILVPPIESQPIEYNFSLWYLTQIFSDRYAFINIVGNAMLFAPLVILGKASKMRMFMTLRSAAISSFVISVGIEALQAIEMHFGLVDPASTNVSDINDVIINTIGGIIGWGIVYYWRKSLEKIVHQQ